MENISSWNSQTEFSPTTCIIYIQCIHLRTRGDLNLPLKTFCSHINSFIRIFVICLLFIFYFVFLAAISVLRFLFFFVLFTTVNLLVDVRWQMFMHIKIECTLTTNSSALQLHRSNNKLFFYYLYLSLVYFETVSSFFSKQILQQIFFYHM